MKIPKKLEEIANGRDHIRTDEFAFFLSKAPQTIRRHHCEKGSFLGIKPAKVGTSLLWPVEDIAKLFLGKK